VSRAGRDQFVGTGLPALMVLGSPRLSVAPFVEAIDGVTSETASSSVPASPAEVKVIRERRSFKQENFTLSKS